MDKTKTQDFEKVIREFLASIDDVFPEFKEITTSVVEMKNEELFEYCKKIYPERFFDILYQNEEIFDDDEIDTKFIPGLDFKDIWKLNDVSENTKNTIWKYLQLIVFSVVSNIDNENSFGDTAKLFEAINEDSFKEKLEETLEKIQETFADNDNENLNNEDIPNSNDLHEHIQGMLNGKIGQLANEIAEETAKELDLDMEDAESANEIFSKVIKNPKKLMSLVKSIGTKLEDKIKSGEIKESELMSEASEMMKQMKNMPGMGNLGQMMSSMGIPGMGKKTKLNMGAMQSKLDQNIKLAQTKERLQKKVEQRKKERSLAEEVERLKKELAAADTRSIDEIVAEIESVGGVSDASKNKTNQNNQNNQQKKKKKKKSKK